jgi:hypothetical protein
LAKICTKGQLHCFGESKAFKYDIWTSFITNNKFFIVPINVGIMESIILPFTTIRFRKILLPIPNNSIKLLNFIYNNWQEPITENWRKQTCKKVL